MLRTILGVIGGFIVWTILIRATDAAWIAMSPDWFGKSQHDLLEAMNNKTPFVVDSTILFILVIRSAILTVISGFVTAWIAKENFKSSIALGILLSAVGILVSALLWNNAPLWYHLGILLPLIPLAILGGKLKKIEEVHNF